MGLFSKINSKYIEQFYYKEFDEKYKLYSLSYIGISVESMLDLHQQLHWALMKKRDLKFRREELEPLLIASLSRNNCPIELKYFKNPILIYRYADVTPSHPDYNKIWKQLEDQKLINNN